MDDISLYVPYGPALTNAVLDKVTAVKGELAERGLQTFASWIDHSHSEARIYIGKYSAGCLKRVTDIIRKYNVRIECAR